jgi:hypothetical protein
MTGDSDQGLPVGLVFWPFEVTLTRKLFSADPARIGRFDCTSTTDAVTEHLGRVFVTLRACARPLRTLTLGQNTRIWQSASQESGKAPRKRTRGANYRGRGPISRALSVAFSKHEFRTSTQSDEDPS